MHAYYMSPCWWLYLYVLATTSVCCSGFLLNLVVTKSIDLEIKPWIFANWFNDDDINFTNNVR